MRIISIIAHDIRSTHNVGSILRTADGFGVQHVYFSGYTPYPKINDDQRLPHVSAKLDAQIHKTALGAEHTVGFSHHENVTELIKNLKSKDYTIIGLEQDPNAVKLPELKAPDKCAVLIGREVEGIDDTLKKHCDILVEIPMYGKKESFNVVQSAAVALYALREA